MRTLIRGMVTASLFIFWQCSLAQTSVWQVSNGSNTVYFGGTIHMLRASDYPLPPAFEQAYVAADNLYFEIDLDDMDSIASQMAMLQQLMYTDGQNLQTVLNEEAYRALSDYTSQLGIPMMLLQNMKPGMLVSTLEIMAFQQLGFTPQGVDLTFNQRAKADGKAIAGLETAQEQISFLTRMGESEESEFVLLSLRDLETIADNIDSMIEPWREGDVAALDDLFIGQMQAETPEVYEELLVRRNRAWMPEIESMLADADTEFVLVGVAHMVGEDGLLQMLRRRGYQVRQL